MPSSTFRAGLFSLVILVIGSIPLTAQVWTRAKGFGGAGSDDGISMKITPSGDRYLTGYFSDSATFGSRTLASAGDTDVFLAKFGEWVVQIGGAAHDEPSDVAFDSAGNVYVTGWFTDSATFYSRDGQNILATGSGETIFIAKYSSTGVLNWVQTGTESVGGNNRGHGIAIDGSGNVFVTGMSQGNTTFSSSNGNLGTVPGLDYWHEYIVKYDANGNFLWGESNSAAPNSVPHKVAVDSAGNAYVVGWFESQATFSSADGNNQTVMGLSQPVQSAPDYPDDGFVVKYDSNGNVKWVNDIGGYKAIMNDVTVDASGNVSVTGFIGNLNGTSQQQETLVSSQPPGSAINLGGGILTSPYNRDIFVATYSAAGVALDARRLGGANDEEGGSILSSGNDLYVAGMLEANENLFITKLSGGTAQWMRQGGPITAGPEDLPRIAMSSENQIVAIGAYTDAARFGSFTLTSNGEEDGFLVELKAP